MIRIVLIRDFFFFCYEIQAISILARDKTICYEDFCLIPWGQLNSMQGIYLQVKRISIGTDTIFNELNVDNVIKAIFLMQVSFCE